MKNVFIQAGIYRNVYGDCFACMDVKPLTSGLYSGTQFVVFMDDKGQHELIHESEFNYVYLGTVQANDAHDILRLLKELNFDGSHKDLKTYVWGYQLLNPVSNLNFNLELWKS